VGGVVNILAGQIESDDLPAASVNANVQLG
jgi:hypothetical protein